MKRLALFLFAVSAWGAQAFRVDPSPVLTTMGSAPSGFPQAFLVPGATISICTDVACTIPAATYTDASAANACPVNAQVVLAGTTQCQSTTGPLGDFGFWLASGTYYYLVVYPDGSTFGAFPITSSTTGVLSIIGGAGISVSAATGNVTITNTALGGVTSFNTRTGAVVPATSDYAFSQISGTAAVNQGGTGSTTAGGARAALGSAASGANSDILSLAGLTTPLSTPQGGTGVANPTAHAMPIAEGGSAMTFVAPGTNGYCWMSNGAGMDPSYQVCAGSIPTTLTLATRTTAVAYTFGSTDFLVRADVSSGGFSVKLPASPTMNQAYELKNVGSANIATLDGNGNTIDAQSTIGILPKAALEVIWNGATWDII